MASSLALVPIVGLAAGATQAQAEGQVAAFFAERSLLDGLGTELVIVEPVARDVRVRVVRIERAHELCPAEVVSAIERVIPATTVQAVADVEMCELGMPRVERALVRAPARQQPAVEPASTVEAVTASCGGEWRRFEFRQPPVIDKARLRRRDGRVWRLWAAGERARALTATRPALDLVQRTTPDWEARESLGTTLVPDLVAGPYGLAERLAGYDGPPSQREPLPVELVERESLPIVDYLPPRFPPAVNGQAVTGDVRLRLDIDVENGAVTASTALSGAPELAANARAAARGWRFEPGAAPPAVDVTLRFQVRCPVASP